MAERALSIQINPALFVWARKSMGFTVDQAAKKIGVDIGLLIAWENGSELPSFSQLEKMGKAYKRPTAVFLLAQPPSEPPLPRDFRLLPGTKHSYSTEALLEFRKARHKREIALSLATATNQKIPEFKLRGTLDDDPKELAREARLALGLNAGSEVKNPKYLQDWKSKVESLGVLVFQVKCSVDRDFRGVSIAEFPLPSILLSKGDSKPARVFTLAHELCHLILRKSSVCSLKSTANPDNEDKQTEVFCNAFAGSFLVPEDALLADENVKSDLRRKDWDDLVIARLSNQFGVSQETILRRFLDLGYASQAFYQAKRREYSVQFAMREKQRKEELKKRPIRIHPHVKSWSANGALFTTIVLTALSRNHIDTLHAAEALGVRTNYVDRIREFLRRGPK